MHRAALLMAIIAHGVVAPSAQAEDAASGLHRSVESSTIAASCRPSAPDGFENIQIETSDIRLHEQLFEDLLHAPAIQRLDHPLTDHIRIYCYRGITIIICQDLRTPRPTGWVQLNFTVMDVVAVQQQLESAYCAYSFACLSEPERDKIVRFRMKPGVMRGNRKVDRLEVYGPEGFLIGFDQPQ